MTPDESIHEEAGMNIPETAKESDPLIDPKEAPQLTWPQKILYGLPQLNVQFCNSLVNSWINYFYLPPKGTSPALVNVSIFGALFMTGRILNALIDPPIGYLSDQSTFRLGRRIPFILVGTPILAILFAMLWFPPFMYETMENAVYFGFVYLAYNAAYGMTISPYSALLPELSSSKQERVVLSAFSGFFSLLGHALGALVGPSLTFFEDGFVIFGYQFTSGLQFLGIIGAIMQLFGFYICLSVTREKPKTRTISVESSLFHELWVSFRNPSFRSLIGVSALLPAGMIMVAAGFPYLCTQILEREDAATPGLVKPGKGELWVGILSAMIFLGALVWMPLVTYFVKRYGKKHLLMVAGSMSCVIISAISIVGYFPGDPAIVALIVVTIETLPAAFLFVLPPAVYADVVDYDERKTGVRREGIYAGAQSLCNKSAIGICSALITYILSLGNSRENSLGISVLYLVAGFVIGLGTLMFSRHPIGK